MNKKGLHCGSGADLRVTVNLLSYVSMFTEISIYCSRGYREDRRNDEKKISSINFIHF